MTDTFEKLSLPLKLCKRKFYHERCSSLLSLLKNLGHYHCMTSAYRCYGNNAVFLTNQNEVRQPARE